MVHLGFSVLLQVNTHIRGEHGKNLKQYADAEPDAAADTFRSVAVVPDAVAHGQAVNKFIFSVLVLFIEVSYYGPRYGLKSCVGITCI